MYTICKLLHHSNPKISAKVHQFFGASFPVCSSKFTGFRHFFAKCWWNFTCATRRIHFFCFRPFPETTLLERRRRRGAVLSSKKEKRKKITVQRSSLTGLLVVSRLFCFLRVHTFIGKDRQQYYQDAYFPEPPSAHTESIEWGFFAISGRIRTV